MATGFFRKVSRMIQPIDEMSLIQAVQDDSMSTVQELLEKKVELNYTNSEGKSALYYAIKNKNSSIVKLLLDKGASIYDSYYDDEISADLAIQIYDLEGKIPDTNEKIIVNLIEEQILKDSILILKDFKTSLDEAKAEVREKISELLKRLNDRNSSSYKDANTFIQFLEIFSFDDDTQHVDDLKREFLKDDSTAYDSIKNLRNAVLHYERGICDPESLFDSIGDCLVSDNKDSIDDKKIQFFDKLEKFLKRFEIKHSDEPLENISISDFLRCSKNQINDIISKGQQDNANDKIIYKKFMNLIVKAFKNETDEEEFWFEFTVNIGPCLGVIIKVKYIICQIETEILRFRNESVDLFDQFFSEPTNYESIFFIVTCKLFKYYYAKKLHESLKSGITRRVEKIEEEICKDCENILNEFKNFIYRLSKDISANCLLTNKKIVSEPRPSILFDQTLVESYFMFMPIIDYAIKLEREKSSKSNSHLNHYLVLGDLSRVQFFDRFEDIKKCKEKNDEENYLQEKEKLISDLSKFGVDRKYVEKIFRYYIEEGNKLSDAAIVIVKKIIKFVKHIGYYIINREVEDNLIDIMGNILANPIDLMPENISDIPMVRNLVEAFTSVNIHDIKVDVKTTIKTMVKTLYNYYYLYNMKKRFINMTLSSSSTFLNTLLNEEKKLLRDYNKSLGEERGSLFKSMRLYILIHQLIKIDHLSPFIVKLLKNLDTEDSKFIKSLLDEDMMRRLIKNLANNDYSDYLNNLFSVEFETYNLYTLLYDYITVNIKNLDLCKNNEPRVFSIFQSEIVDFNFSSAYFDRIKRFADVLISTKNEQSLDDIEKIIIPFLAIINGEVECQLNFTSTVKECDILSEVLLKSIEIEHKFSKKVNQFTPCCVHFIERDILQAKINTSYAGYDRTKVINLLKSVIDKLDTCENINHREIHDRYKLLIFGLFADIGVDCQDLYRSILKYVKGEDYEDTEIENVAKIYKKIKNNKIYKQLLSTSELLDSIDHLNVLELALRWISSALQDVKQRGRDFKDEDEKKLLKILEFYQSIYSLLTRSYNSSQHLKRISPDIYKQLGIVCEARNNYNEASCYCLKALARFKTLNKNYAQDVQNDVLTVFITYISAQYNFSKTLTNKQDLSKREDTLKKVDDLCIKLLDCEKHSSALEEWPKQCRTIHSVVAKVSHDRGMCCLEKNLINEARRFFKRTLNVYEEILNEKGHDNE